MEYYIATVSSLRCHVFDFLTPSFLSYHLVFFRLNSTYLLIFYGKTKYESGQVLVKNISVFSGAINYCSGNPRKIPKLEFSGPFLRLKLNY